MTSLAILDSALIAGSQRLRQNSQATQLPNPWGSKAAIGVQLPTGYKSQSTSPSAASLGSGGLGWPPSCTPAGPSGMPHAARPLGTCSPLIPTAGATVVITSQKESLGLEGGYVLCLQPHLGFEPDSQARHLGFWLLLPEPPLWPPEFQCPVSPVHARHIPSLLCLASPCKCHLLQGASSACWEMHTPTTLP